MTDPERRALHEQREEERRALRRKKQDKRKKIAWIVIAVLIVVLVALRISEIDFASVSQKHTDSDGHFSFNSGYDNEAYPYALDSSNDTACAELSNKIAVLTAGSFQLLNPADATEVRTVVHRYANPVLQTAGSYALIYDQGGVKFRLETDSKTLYEQTADHSILCAAVGANGTVAVATLSDSAKCSIIVYSKSLEKINTYDISLGYVAQLAVDSSGSNIAYACFDSQNAALKTYVCYQGDEAVTAELDCGALLDLQFRGSKVYCVCAGGVALLDRSGELQSVFSADTPVQISAFCYNPAGDLVVCSAQSDTAATAQVSVISENARLDTKFDVDFVPQCIAASRSVYAVYNGTDIYLLDKSGAVTDTVSSVDSVSAMQVVSRRLFYIQQSMLSCHSL